MAETDSAILQHYELLQQELQQKVHNLEYTNAELTKLFDTYKKQGDNAFKAVDYEQAIHYYSLALICHDDTVTFANRSLAHFKLENYVKALADGERSVELDRKYIKGYYRVGVCQMALQNYNLAISAFSQLLELQPNEVGARQQLQNARKAYREQQYALAIGGGSEDAQASSVFNRINWDLQVPKSYNGPELNLSIQYMQENLYTNNLDIRHTEDEAQNIRLFSRKYTAEFVHHVVYDIFANETTQSLPRIFVYHILRDFTDLMRSLPTVVDYCVPQHTPLDSIDDSADKTSGDDAEGDGTDMEDCEPKQVKSPNRMSDSPAIHCGQGESDPHAEDKDTTMDDQETAVEKKHVATIKEEPKTTAPGKLIVCGDTHGQFWDLLNIFKLYGNPSITNPYLFNGDFVDRGSFGFELVLTLMIYKLHCPLSMHMTRGNHETINMNRSFGFYGEVLHKADLPTFDCFTQAFNALPLAYVLGKKVLILHGGLPSDENASLEDLRSINRFRQPPEHGGLMVDCLWSDPHAFIKGRRASVRGAGCQFGADITTNWLRENNLELLVRSHEMKHAGFEINHGGKLVTIFSAPNYVDTMGNKGAVMIFDSDYSYQFRQFEAVFHPPVRAMHYADPYLR